MEFRDINAHPADGPRNTKFIYFDLFDRLFFTQNSLCKEMSVRLPAGTAITWQPDNPYRGGTASYTRYDLYKGASTIGEARSLGATPQDLKTGLSKGYGQL